MKKTKWFPPELTPVRNGLYEAKDRLLEQYLWDGKAWRTPMYEFIVAHQDVTWRGLANPPKETK